MKTALDLMSLEESKIWLLENGYHTEDLTEFDDIEIRVLATDQKARKEEE